MRTRPLRPRPHRSQAWNTPEATLGAQGGVLCSPHSAPRQEWSPWLPPTDMPHSHQSYSPNLQRPFNTPRNPLGRGKSCFCPHKCRHPPSWVPGGGDPVFRHGGPGPVHTPLLLELALKPSLDVIQVEGADSRAGDAKEVGKRSGQGVGGQPPIYTTRGEMNGVAPIAMLGRAIGWAGRYIGLA